MKEVKTIFDTIREDNLSEFINLLEYETDFKKFVDLIVKKKAYKIAKYFFKKIML